MTGRRLLLFLGLTIVIFSNSTIAVSSPKPATEATKAINAQWLKILPFANKQDFNDAAKGLIAPLPNNGVIKDENGRAV